MTPSRRAVAAAAILVSAASGLSAQAAAPASARARTATRALTVTLAPLGAVPAAQRLRLSVALTPRDAAGLTALAREATTPGTAAYHHFLTPAQVAARFAPTPATVAEVTGWLAHSGFTGISVQPNRLLVDASGSAAAAERAFATGLERYRGGSGVVYANTAPASVPARLAGSVTAVLGLSDLPMDLPHVIAPAIGARRAALAAELARDRASAGRLAATAVPDLNGFTPVQIARIYDASGMAPARDTSIAVLTSGDMSSTISDLRYAESVYKVPQAAVSVQYTATPKAVTEGNPYTGNLEWDLDTQMSTIDAGTVRHLYLYDSATIDDADITRDINLFVSQDLARAGSASLGECDASAYLDGAMIATDDALAEGTLQGQSFFASSGDNGFACPEIASTGVPGGVPGASWPADGFFTTAVGGTTLLATSGGQYQDELSWIGGGGGISEFESAGGWQYRANPAAQAGEYLPSGGRGVPDIAAVADENTPVVVYQDKQRTYVGGTSVSSPLSLGLWARMETAHRNALGLASQDFYDLYTRSQTGPAPSGARGFHDIVLGSNGLWVATPGYDYTTGIGSFDAAALSRLL